MYLAEGSENGPQEKVAATDRPELDNGTDQGKGPYTCLCLADWNKDEKKVLSRLPQFIWFCAKMLTILLTILENPKEAPSNKEGHDTPKDSASSTKILPIKLDILKSIVYGGLIESITSFGVVSSAAATGTSTRKYTWTLMNTQTKQEHGSFSYISYCLCLQWTFCLWG